MKTKHVWLAMAALAIAGCSQNEITEVSPQNTHPAIGFDVYTGVQTKGTETTATSMQTSGFGILAYKTTSDGWSTDGTTAKPDFMYNEHATYSNGWTYTNTKYWPTNGDKVTFFAYAPYDDQGSGTPKTVLSAITATGAPTITFTQADAAADLVDLVVADAKDKTFITNAASSKVAFAFKHILTKIDVKAKLTEDIGSHTKIFVTGMKLKSDGKLYKKATYQMAVDGAGTWSYDTTGGKAEAWGNDGVLDLAGILNKNNTATWGYTANQGKEVSTTAATVFSGGGAQHFLYMIPVANKTGTTTAGDATLEVTYDIVTTSNQSSHTKSTTVQIAQLPSGAFKAGTSATYTLKIGLNKIEIGTVTVNDNWSSSTGDLDVKDPDPVP